MAEHISALITAAREWAAEGKEDLAHHALDVIAEQGDEGGGGVPCPKCGETERVEDTGNAEQPRLTCKRCGHSWNPMEDDRG
jgi:hypothetical protein